MLCIYHIADHDGKGSAAIVKSVYPQAEMFGYNHDMEVPYDIISKHNEIVICDIALPVDYMLELNNKIELVWIDHHISVISQYEQAIANGAKPIKGLRKVGVAAIELTWNYFYPQTPVPLAIDLLAKNDLFDLRDKRVRPFEFAMQAMGANFPQDEIWKSIIDSSIDIDSMVHDGEKILSWINARNARLVKMMSFETELEGYKCLCANMPQGYSSFYDSVENLEEYDVLINFYMNRNKLWSLTFYSSKKDVDVSILAAKFGGGGHKGAAGASKLKELPEFMLKNIK